MESYLDCVDQEESDIVHIIFSLTCNYCDQSHYQVFNFNVFISQICSVQAWYYNGPLTQHAMYCGPCLPPPHLWSCAFVCACVYSYLQEYTALGTGGGMYHFRDQINSGNPDLFFVLNADVCCDFPLQQMMDFQKASKAEFVILGTEVVGFISKCCVHCVAVWHKTSGYDM